MSPDLTLMVVVRRDVEAREYRSVRPSVFLKRRIEGSYSRTGVFAFAEQPKKCSDRVKNVFCIWRLFVHIVTIL